MKVTYIDHMGSDLSVVNAARVSFGKKSDYAWSDEGQAISKKDQGLIQFLARGCTSGEWDDLLDDALEGGWYDIEDVLKYVKNMPSHWTPFAHTTITLHMKLPIFCARQIAKHQVGFVINEVSRRYVDDDPEFYVPEWWRERAPNVKQGSGGQLLPEYLVDSKSHNAFCLDYYQTLLRDGVCPEQARMVLPQSMMTEWYMTGNLYGWANMYIQRTDSHAQRETQIVAHQVGDIIKPLFPVSWEALTG